MYAIIRCEDGTYYKSFVFAHFCNVNSNDDYKRQNEYKNTSYYVVLDKSKNKLVKVHEFKQNSIHIIYDVMIVDYNDDDLIHINKDEFHVSFINKTLIEEYFKTNTIPDNITKKCIEMDKAYIYEEYKTIQNSKDIENFMDCVGGFHDAYIENIKVYEDGIYLLFKGLFTGLNLEIWFDGDIKYKAKTLHERLKDGYGDYWFDASFIKVDDSYYLINEAGLNEEDIVEETNDPDTDFIFVKGNKVKYRLLPETYSNE